MARESSMKKWLAEELGKVEQTYLVKARNITGPYHREIALKKEYDGRQLLELLQNADDEAEDAKDPAVLIRLEENRLVVANNGKPFSKSGVASLIDSDNSPKKMSRRKIGYKGLGFRAVLNWSDSIWIKSGGFSIEFSRAEAVEFFRILLKKKPSLGTEMQEHFGYRYDKECPIATLAVPSWKESWDFETSEYDTYVVINFSDDAVREDIQRQISGLSMEVALFLNNLRKIVLESPSRKQTIERVPSRHSGFEEIRILDERREVIASKKWRIFHRSDELPEQLRIGENAEQYEYDIRIAVSENMDDSVNRLFTYFKTEVKFPFPAIVHGTFELNDSRYHLVKSPTNTFLLRELANLMIDSAKKLTQRERGVSWDSIKLLTKKGEFDDKVEVMGFYEHLLETMKSHKLIPVLSGGYMSVEEAPVFYGTPFADVLKNFPDIFPDLSLYIEDEDVRSLITELGIGTYEKKKFMERIDRVSPRLAIGERAELILLVAKNYSSYFRGIEPEEMPSLLIDEKGREIKSKNQALLPPERAKFQLPDNVKIHFVSDDLCRLLRKKAGVKRARDLASELSCFNLDEYRFDTVIRRIVNVTNRLIREDRTKSDEYIKSMLLSLFQIYHDDPEASKQFPANINVAVPSRSGAVRSTRELYFGKEYSAGEIMETIYSRIDDSAFIKGKKELGLGDKSESEVFEFLKWMGIEEYPRIVNKKLSNQDYHGYDIHVLINLPYTYETNYGEKYSSYEELKSEIWQYGTDIEISYIEGLEDILRETPFEVILAWLHCDDQLQRVLKSGKESSVSSDSVVKISISRKQYKRYISAEDISSFILWKLKNTEWIKTRSGKQVKPSVCCLSRTVDDMSPLIEIPAYEMSIGIFKSHNIKQDDIEYILKKVGVAPDFGKLADETIYDILASLESSDPEGKKAESIYRQIIKSKPLEWAREIRNAVARNRFVAKGTLLAKHGGKLEYRAVKDVYYVENITFCRQIIDKFSIAKIPRRSGNEQVRDIFGVTPLEDIKFGLADPTEVHPLNSDFARAFESFKPYVLVFRLERGTFGVELNKLKRLKIVLCTHIPAKYEFDDKKEDLVLHPYEHVYVSEENTAYVLLESKKHSNISDLKEDITFCEAFAEILTGILKVGENRKDYRDLFPKNRRQRDITIRNDLDDPELAKLRQAKQFFGGLSELELEFWESVLRTKGKPETLEEDKKKADTVGWISEELGLDSEFVKEIYEGIYYEEYNSTNNLPFFKRLFENLGVSVRDFNRHSHKEIDFRDCIRKEIEREKCRLRSKFKSLAFAILKEGGIEQKKRFVNFLEAFDSSSVETKFDINKELKLDIEGCMNILLKRAPFEALNIDYGNLHEKRDDDPDGEYAKNKKGFEKKIDETGGGYIEDIESFLNVPENRSLLYFGEINELVERFDKKYSRPSKEGEPEGGAVRKKKSIMLNGVDVEYDEDDYEALARSVDEDLKNDYYEIESHEPSKPEEKVSEGTGHGGGGPLRGSVKKRTKEIGFLGEKYVYEALVKEHTKEKVIWASDYARKVNVNPEGRDDIGYDIRYSDEKGNTHYVEVKATKNDEPIFSISRAEVRFGELNKSDYEVILVLNVCDKNRKLINIGKIFEFTEDETFSNNSKFVVDTENFRVKFNYNM